MISGSLFLLLFVLYWFAFGVFIITLVRFLYFDLLLTCCFGVFFGYFCLFALFGGFGLAIAGFRMVCMLWVVVRGLFSVFSGYFADRAWDEFC